MNIAYIGVYSDNKVSGVHITAFITAVEIAKLGHQVFFYGIGDRTISEYKNGITIRIFKKEGFSLPPGFKVFLRDNPDKIDIFHLRSVFRPINYFVAKKLKRLNYPYVMSPHGGYNINIFKRQSIIKKLYYVLFERFYFLNAKGAHSCAGEREIEDIKRLKFKGKVRAIWNPVYAKEKIQLKHSKKLVYLGRFDIHHKGLDVLLNLFKEVEMLDESISLDLYGQGPDKDKLIGLLNQLKIKNVKIHDPIFGKEKEEVLKEANAYIQTSRWEAFGRSIAESMVLGLPVIITNGYYLSDFVRQHKIGIFVSENYKKSAQGIVEFMNDFDLLLKISERSHEITSKEFNPPHIAAQNVDFYKEVISG